MSEVCEIQKRERASNDSNPSLLLRANVHLVPHGTLFRKLSMIFGSIKRCRKCRHLYTSQGWHISHLGLDGIYLLTV